MSKITFQSVKSTDFKELSEEELKNVIGGLDGSGGSGGTGTTSCTCSLKAKDGDWYGVSLDPEPTTEEGCSGRCRATYNDVLNSGGKVSAWDAVFVSN